MRLSIVWTIFIKEVTEAMRDWLTLAVVVGLPIAVYPLMIFGLAKIQRTQARTQAHRASRIGLWGRLPTGLGRALQPTNHFAIKSWQGIPSTLRQELEATNPPSPSSTAHPGPDNGPKANAAGKEEPRLVDRVQRAARLILTRRQCDAVLVLWPGFAQALAADGTGKASIYYDSVQASSLMARKRLLNALSDYRRHLVETRERARGLSEGFSRAVEIHSSNVAPPRRQAGERLGILLPFVLIMLSASGALYAAIDLTAGEKDRATMQTLLCAPISNLEIVTGKFLAVWSISLISAVANMASLGATVARLSASAELFGLPVSNYLLAFALLLPATFMVTSFFLAVAVLARDAKDAGNFLAVTLTLLVMPLVAAMMPGVELDAWTAFVPLVNVSLLIKSLFLAEAKANAVFLTLISSVTYAMLAMLFAANAFGREQILLGGRASLKSLFRHDRTTAAPPTPAMALTAFAAILVLAFYGSLLLEKRGVVTTLLVTEFGFFLLPLVFLSFALKFPINSTFSLRRPPARGWIAAILMGISAWAAVGGLVIRLLPPPDSLVKALSRIVLLGSATTPIWILWLVVAITPAFCEELFFRGFVLSALRRWGNGPALALSSLLFALAHASLYRLLPTFFLGLLLGYLVLRTGSIGCSMIVHALNNGIAVTLARYPALAKALHLESATFLPWSLTLPALAVLALAFLLLAPAARPGLTSSDQSG